MGNWLANYFYQTDDQAPSGESRESPRSTTSSSDLESMCHRVKEVLPQVPKDVIIRDLRITADVDESITRLLDGTVKYIPISSSLTPSSSSTPLKPSSSQTSDKPSPASIADAPSLSTAASSFGNNSNERMKSLEERKKMLVEASRIRYLAKHQN